MLNGEAGGRWLGRVLDCLCLPVVVYVCFVFCLVRCFARLFRSFSCLDDLPRVCFGLVLRVRIIVCTGVVVFCMYVRACVFLCVYLWA